MTRVSERHCGPRDDLSDNGDVSGSVDSPHLAPVVACVSTLADANVSAALGHTLGRLSRCESVDASVVLCWEDQVAEATRLAGKLASIVPVGSRQEDPSLSLVHRAQVWADGWRSGLLATCPADRGWHADAVQQIAEATDAGFIYAVDACFALLDPALTDNLIRHAQSHAETDEPVFFTPAPPGLVGLLVTRATSITWQRSRMFAVGIPVRPFTTTRPRHASTPSASLPHAAANPG